MPGLDAFKFCANNENTFHTTSASAFHGLPSEMAFQSCAYQLRDVHRQRDAPQRTSGRSILRVSFDAGDMLRKSHELGVKL